MASAIFNYKNIEFDYLKINTRTRLIIIFSIGVFVALFLNLFEPFGIRNADWNWLYVLIISGYGVMTILIMLFNEFVLKMRFSHSFNPGEWNHKKSILWFCWYFISLTLGMFFYKNIWAGVHADYSVAHLLIMIFRVSAIGIFPVLGFTFYLWWMKTRHQIETLDKEQDHLISKLYSNSISPIKITSENEKEALVLNPEDWLYIRNEDNYVAVFIGEKGRLRHQLIRSTMSRIENMLLPHGAIRCHRSFIVNTRKIRKFKKIGKKYMLILEDLDQAIPVSKKYEHQILSLLS